MDTNITSLSVIVTPIGANGAGDPKVRPLRVMNDGSGFCVVMRGKVVPLTATGASSGAVDLRGARFDRELSRAAKNSDIGKVVAQAAPQVPEAVAAKTTAPKGKGNLPGLLKGQQTQLRNAMAKGDDAKVARCNKAIATITAKMTAFEAPVVTEAAAPVSDLDELIEANGGVLALINALTARL